MIIMVKTDHSSCARSVEVYSQSYINDHRSFKCVLSYISYVGDSSWSDSKAAFARMWADGWVNSTKEIVQTALHEEKLLH